MPEPSPQNPRARTAPRITPVTPLPPRIEPPDRDDQEDVSDPVQRIHERMAKFRASSQTLRTRARQRQQSARNKSQEATRKKVKQLIPKLAMMLANGLASVLEIGSGGIMFIVTLLVRFFTLGWANLEVFYGGIVKRGKHPIIGPRVLGPIPMPMRKMGGKKNPNGPLGANDILPTLLVLGQDLFVLLGVLLVVVVLGTLILLLTKSLPTL